MDEVFGPGYAGAYDIFYQNKDYKAECDLIEQIFEKYGDGSVRSILDLGCGTGNHAIPLGQRGYETVGVDRAEGMLSRARRKAHEVLKDKGVTFSQGDLRSVNLGRSFDAVLMMFAVLGYQLENADVLAALQTARRHMRPGGIFIYDVWYGPAVLHHRPSQQIKVVPTPEGQLLRVASGQLDTQRNLCTVDYRVWRIDKGARLEETEESHRMRYFFLPELKLLLERAGLIPLRFGAFPDFNRDPDETTWNILGVAQADANENKGPQTDD